MGVGLTNGCDRLARWWPRTEESAAEPAVAQVGEAVLTEAQLQRMVPPTPDSALYAEWRRHAVEQWVDRQLVYLEARTHLPPSVQDSLETVVESFRREIWAHTYARLQAARLFDSTVTDADIETYYRAHRGLFRAPDTFLHLRFAAVPTDRLTRRLRRKIPYWLARAANAAASDSLLKYCALTDADCNPSGRWLSPEGFAQRFVGLPSATWNQLMRRIGTVTRITTPSRTYWLMPTDRRYPGQEAPLEIVRSHIQQILRQQRFNEAVDAAYQQIARRARTSPKYVVKTQLHAE